MEDKKHGGARPGSGRKKREPTSLINFRVNAEKKMSVKAKYGRTLNKLFAEWFNSL